MNSGFVHSPGQLTSTRRDRSIDSYEPRSILEFDGESARRSECCTQFAHSARLHARVDALTWCAMTRVRRLHTFRPRGPSPRVVTQGKSLLEMPSSKSSTWRFIDPFETVECTTAKDVVMTLLTRSHASLDALTTMPHRWVSLAFGHVKGGAWTVI